MGHCRKASSFPGEAAKLKQTPVFQGRRAGAFAETAFLLGMGDATKMGMHHSWLDKHLPLQKSKQLH